jgi:hypothetical protein
MNLSPDEQSMYEYIKQHNNPLSEWQVRRHFTISDSHLRRISSMLQSKKLILIHKKGGCRMYSLINKEPK